MDDANEANEAPRLDLLGGPRVFPEVVEVVIPPERSGDLLAELRHVYDAARVQAWRPLEWALHPEQVAAVCRIWRGMGYETGALMLDLSAGPAKFRLFGVPVVEVLADGPWLRCAPLLPRRAGDFWAVFALPSAPWPAI